MVKEKMLEDFLQQTLNAESRILKALPKRTRAAQAEGHVEHLQQVSEILGKPARGKSSDMIERIALAAGLTSTAQAVEHYEDLPRRRLKAAGNETRGDDDVRLLDERLKEKANDLTKLADRAKARKAARTSTIARKEHLSCRFPSVGSVPDIHHQERGPAGWHRHQPILRS